MRQLHQTVGIEGAYETLHELEASSVTALPAEEMLAMMKRVGVQHPEATLRDFVADNLLHQYGERFGLTTLGIRTCLLLEAINGGELRDVFRRLSRLDSTLRTYELIREGMTGIFLQNLNERPGFSRLYFCSPWISLGRRQQEMLLHAVIQSERKHGMHPEILVITRPDENNDLGVPTTLKPFQDLGATFFLNKRLHTKLYIREPDSSGTYAMAILGSQNLTKSNYIELGIRINSDGQMIDQLISYFLEIAYSSDEV